MNAVTFQTIREGLGYTRDSIAADLGVREKTIRGWELDRQPIPDGVAEEMISKVDEFAEEISDIAEKDTVRLKAWDRETRALAFSVLVLNPETNIA